MDFKIGCLHAYPNGELQFENHRHDGNVDSDDNDAEVANINNKRYIARKLRGKKDDNQISEQNLENIARAMS